MKIIFVKQYTNASHDDDSRFFVLGVDAYGDKVARDYGLFTLPKYVKKFMAKHECKPFDTEETNPYGIRSFIYLKEGR